MSQQRRGVPSRSLPGASIVVHETLDGLDAAWRTLAERSACHVFQTWEWNSTWCECIGRAEGVAPRIVCILDAQGAMLAIWPLGLYRRGRLRVLAFLGDTVSDYRAPLLASECFDALEPSVFARLWRECEGAVAGADIVALERMPELLGARANPMARLPGAEHSENAYAVRLPDTMQAYASTRSKGLMSAVRRSVRRLADAGALVFTPEHDAGTREEALAAVIRQKSRRWRETGSRDLFAEQPYLAFYRTLTERYAQDGFVSLCSLRVGETIVAAQWGLVLRGRYYWILPGYEPGEWTKWSCGRVLLQNMVEWSIQRGLEVFDLTVGDESYKKDWANERLRLYSWSRARTPLGWIHLSCRRMRDGARSIPWLRQCVRSMKRARGVIPGRSPTDTSE